MIDVLTGQTERHLVMFRKWQVHRDVLIPLQNLFTAADASGLRLQIASSFRSYERQVIIWNEKSRGIRPLYDRLGNLIDIAGFSSEEVVEAILNWSTPPGCSRHHWGTDFDYYDLSRCSKDYKLKLTPDEYAPGGPFERAAHWLAQNMESFGFFQPYNLSLARGPAPEPWHLSAKIPAQTLQKQFDFALFQNFLQSAQFDRVEVLRSQAQRIFDEFVQSESE